MFPTPTSDESSLSEELERARTIGRTLGTRQLAEIGRSDAFEFADDDQESRTWLDLLEAVSRYTAR